MWFGPLGLHRWKVNCNPWGSWSVTLASRLRKLEEGRLAEKTCSSIQNRKRWLKIQHSSGLIDICTVQGKTVECGAGASERNQELRTSSLTPCREKVLIKGLWKSSGMNLDKEQCLGYCWAGGINSPTLEKHHQRFPSTSLSRKIQKNPDTDFCRGEGRAKIWPFFLYNLGTEGHAGKHFEMDMVLTFIQTGLEFLYLKVGPDHWHTTIASTKLGLKDSTWPVTPKDIREGEFIEYRWKKLQKNVLKHAIEVRLQCTGFINK